MSLSEHDELSQKIFGPVGKTTISADDIDVFNELNTLWRNKDALSAQERSLTRCVGVLAIQCYELKVEIEKSKVEIEKLKNPQSIAPQAGGKRSKSKKKLSKSKSAKGKSKSKGRGKSKGKK